MITGVWISPDRERIAIQFDEDQLYGMNGQYTDAVQLESVPADWVSLFTTGE